MSEPRNRGFTLIEVIIVVAILGLIATVIAAAFMVIVRVNPANTERADDSRSVLGLTNYLPQDVSSAAVNPARSIDYIVVPSIFTTFDEAIGPPAGLTLPAGCSLGSGGTISLAGLYWFEGTDVHAVNYRLVDDGGWKIKRFYCAPGSSIIVGLTSVLLSTGQDPTNGTPPVTVNKTSFSASHDDGLEFIIQALSGAILRVDAASDNPAEATLDPPSTVAPPPVTSAENDPPVPTDPQVESLYAGETKLASMQIVDPNGDDVVITSVTEDPPGSWPDDWDFLVTGQTVTVTASSGAVVGASYSLEYIATDDRSDPVTGHIVFMIADPSAGTTTTTTFTPPPPPVPPPCVIDNLSIDSSPTKRVDNKSNSTLQSDVTVTISRSGTCLDLVLVFDPDSSGVQLESSFNDGTVVAIDKNEHLWSKGSHSLCVRDGFGNPDLRCRNLNIT